MRERVFTLVMAVSATALLSFVLSPNASGANYRIVTFTGFREGAAGSNATIQIQLIGDRGSVNGLVLDNPNFVERRRGSRNEFDFQNRRDVGELQRVVIEARGRDNWFANGLIVRNQDTDREWQVSVQENLLDTIRSFPAFPAIDYSITVTTSDIPNAGTDAGVFLARPGIFVQAVKLDDPNRDDHERGQTNTFTFVGRRLARGEDIGQVFIGRDNRNRGPGWHLADIEIREGRPGGRTVRFDHRQWIPPLAWIRCFPSSQVAADEEGADGRAAEPQGEDLSDYLERPGEEQLFLDLGEFFDLPIAQPPRKRHFHLLRLRR